MAKSYKFLEQDKAALLNLLDHYGVTIDSDDIIDDRLHDHFTINIEDPEIIDVIDDVLKKSSKIKTIKEHLKRLIREELTSLNKNSR